MNVKNVLILPSWYPQNASDNTALFIKNQVDALSDSIRVDVQDCSFQLPLIPNYFRILSSTFFGKFRKKPDLIHAHVAYPAGVVALELKKYFNVPVILTEHMGPVQDLAKYFQNHNEFNNHYISYDSIIAVSGFQKNEIQKFSGRTDIEVIGNIIHDDFFNAPLTLNSENLHSACVIAGRLTEEKGILDLLEVLKIYDSLNASKFKLKILGSGPLENKVSETTNNLKNIEVQISSGFGSKTVIDTLQNSQCLILPSKVETFSMVSAEALALGKPVYGFNCGGPSDFVKGNNGKLLSDRNHGALAKILADFFTTSENSLDLMQARRASIKTNYSKDIVKNKLLDLYDKSIHKFKNE